MKRSETEIRNIWSNWTDKRTEPCFYHSNVNDRISICPASHFLKFLSQLAFGTFAKSHKPTHNPSFAKEPNNLTAMNRIKEVLADKGIKQTWLAKKLGKSYNMVNGYEQNRQQPRLEVLFEIAKIMEIDPKELIKTDKPA